MINITKICLIRHGETDWNVIGKLQGKTDIPLNQLGIKQAKECKKYLSQHQWDVIISSPLKRAKRTAEIINESLCLPFYEMDEFIERNFGDAEGMTKSECSVVYPDGNYPNQEDLESLILRLMNGLHKINGKFSNQKILIVAHSAVINAILFQLSEGEIGTGKTRLLNACLNHLQFEENAWKIMSYNQVSHLTEITEKEIMF